MLQVRYVIYDAFKGLTALLTCDYQGALQGANRAKESQNPNFAVSGYWLEALSYADQGNSSRVTQLMPELVEKDWDISNEAAARTNMLQLQEKLVTIRDEYKLPKNCEQ